MVAYNANAVQIEPETDEVAERENEAANTFIRNRGEEPEQTDSFLEKIRATSVSAFDAISRSDYPDEDAYLSALTRYTMAVADPAYQQARKILAVEYSRRIAEEQQAAQRERLEELRKTTRLWENEEAEARKRAETMTSEELLKGTIAHGDFAKRLAENTKKTLADAVEAKAQRQLMNEMLKAARKSSTDR